MELFGTPGGRGQAEQEMAKLALTGAQIQHMGVQDAMAPFTAQQRSAQARWLGTRADEKDREQTIAAYVASRANEAMEVDGRQPDGNDFAQWALEAGDVKGSMDYMSKQATVNQKQAAAATNATRQGLIQSRTRINQMDELARLVRNSQDADQLLGNLQEYEARTKQPTGLVVEGRLAPGLAENWEATRDELVSQAVSERDRTATEARRAALESADALRKARIRQIQQWGDLDFQARLAEARRRPVQDKAGVLKPDNVRAGMDYIGSQFLDIPAPQAKVLGRIMAEMAREITQKNPAITPAEARDQAFNELDRQGRFAGLERRDPKSFDRMKKTEKAPLPLPADADPSKLEVGNWYTNGKEKKLWLGPKLGWSNKAQEAAGRIRPAAAAAEDEADDNLAMDTGDDEEED